MAAGPQGLNVWDSRRLWSLWDMIDFSLGMFWTNLTYLRSSIEGTREHAERNPHEFVPAARVELLKHQLSGIFWDCGNLQLEPCYRTIQKLEEIFRRPLSYGQLKDLLDRLFDDIQHELQKQYFFHYSKEGAESIHKLPEKWGGIYQAFKAAKPEIEAGVDCFALGHFTASVFHMCRTAEIGLRAIGMERGVTHVRGGVPIEWGTWGQVFQAIEPKIGNLKQKPNGPQKDAALAFYQTVLADLRAMQSYRDPAMHFHSSYDQYDAGKAMSRTHSLMEMLAKKLNDETIGEIPWDAWR
jgi:hypothetical protein